MKFGGYQLISSRMEENVGSFVGGRGKVEETMVGMKESWFKICMCMYRPEFHLYEFPDQAKRHVKSWSWIPFVLVLRFEVDADK